MVGVKYGIAAPRCDCVVASRNIIVVPRYNSVAAPRYNVATSRSDTVVGPSDGVWLLLLECSSIALPGEAPRRLKVVRVARHIGRRQEKRQEGEQQEAFRHGFSCGLWYVYKKQEHSARNQFGVQVIL
uniref:Uncharacterized protein n=1 Tax=Triticum urartu TaxID=4572 RepID=A0A8R7K522_TRIUA